MSSYYEKFLDGRVVCIDEEIPFEIPKGWEWCRFSSIYWQLTDGTHATPQYTESGIPFLSVKDMSSGKISFQKTKYISAEEHRTLSLRCNPQKGDLLLSKVGTTGIPAIVDTDQEFSLFVSVALIKFFQEYIQAAFLIHLINSPLVQEQAKNNTRGVGNKNWVLSAIANTMLAIPPFAEQKRIVQRLELIMPVLNKYESIQQALDVLNENINDTLKKSILQEAIQGRLVPQNPDDEPATKLLERINAEKHTLVKEGKLKAKDAITSVIFKGDDNKYYEKTGKDIVDITEEIPFDIPDSWSWCRLGTLFQHNTGKALNQADQKGKLLTYITTSNLYWDRFELDNLRKMYFTDDEIIKCTVQKGDLLVCEGGDIGRAAIWPFEEPVRIQNHIHRLRSYLPIATRFFYYTIAHYKDSGVIGGKGIGIQGLSSGVLHRLLLPVPPLAEQHRVVEKLDETLASIMSR